MISKRLRYEILRRDKHQCRYCGRDAGDGVKLTVDHVRPEALGGKTEPENLVTACGDCNSGKTSTAPDQALVNDADADALRWTMAMKSAAKIQARKRKARKRMVDEFHIEWEWWSSHATYPPRIPTDWVATIERFHDLGLSIDEVVGAVEVAWRRDKIRYSDKWRYFCGVCWRILEERAEMAADMLASDPAEQQGGAA